MNYSKLLNEISTESKIVIVTHKNPDGDAIGSSIGLELILKKIVKAANVIVPNDAPDFLKWIKNYEELINFEKQAEKANRLISNADFIFCLDFNALHRIGALGDIVAASKAKKVMIDHHLQPDDFADYQLSKVSASSTAELVYEFCVALSWDKYLDKDSAEALYTGLITDTGSFKYPSTSVYTHQVAAALIQKGADNGKVHQLVYDSNSITRLKVLGYCLNNMEIISGKFSCFALDRSAQEELNIKKGDTEGIVNYGLSIEQVVVSGFFRQEENEIKISFRSKGDYDVNLFARKYFDGGGHKNAAGGHSTHPLQECIQKYRELVTVFFNA